MERADLTDEQFDALVNAILPILMEKGMTHTSMDFIASSLKMSKRTLYEIFGSKDDMIRAIFDHHTGAHHRDMQELFGKASNAMEGLAMAVSYHQRFFSKASASFFRDMDERFRHLRNEYDSGSPCMNSDFEKILKLGVHQGVFREDVDFDLQLRLLHVQMESIKRMEDFFPPQITMERTFRAITEGFLRTIATHKGLEALEKVLNAKENLH